MTEHLYLSFNPVRSDRAQDFERFQAEVVVPAVRAQRPDLEGRWRVTRTSGPSEGVVTFVFVLEGGRPDDWDLGAVLSAEYGEEEAARWLKKWLDEFAAPLDKWSDAAELSTESNQVLWTLESVPLH